MTLRAGLVDAFTDRPFRGNPAAVVLLDSDPPADDWLQALAAEFNLSETAFVQPLSDAAYRLRWFTPTTEVELCGHATLAAAHWLRHTGLDDAPVVVFHTISGALTASWSPTGITLDLPAIPVAVDGPLAGATEALGGAGLRYLGHTGQSNVSERNAVCLGSAATVRELQPDMRAVAALPVGGVIVTAPGDEDGVDFVSRYFAPAAGIEEDPVTGSAHCTLGPYWAEELGRTTLTAYQASSRGGWLRVAVDGGRVLLTGQAVTTADVLVHE